MGNCQETIYMLHCFLSSLSFVYVIRSESENLHIRWRLPGNDNKFGSALMRTGLHNTTGKFLTFRAKITLPEENQAHYQEFGYFAVYLKDERYLSDDVMILLYSSTWLRTEWTTFTYSLPHGIYDVIFEVQKNTYRITKM